MRNKHMWQPPGDDLHAWSKMFPKLRATRAWQASMQVQSFWKLGCFKQTGSHQTRIKVDLLVKVRNEVPMGTGRGENLRWYLLSWGHPPVPDFGQCLWREELIGVDGTGFQWCWCTWLLLTLSPSQPRAQPAMPQPVFPCRSQRVLVFEEGWRLGLEKKKTSFQAV